MEAMVSESMENFKRAPGRPSKENAPPKAALQTAIKIDRVKFGYSVRIGNKQETCCDANTYLMEVVNIGGFLPCLKIQDKHSKQIALTTMFNVISFQVIGEI